MKLVTNFKFVPKYKPLNDCDLVKMNDFISNSKKLFVLTGAGISTESGIPDYRSEDVGLYHTSNHKPMQHSDFISSSSKRKIYWARNYASWPIFSSFRPNVVHHTLSNWERKGKVLHHVTQNVDSLLVKAGCVRLTELHGSSYKVKCLDCGFRLTRESMQLLIKSQNPDWFESSEEIAPDNDVRLLPKQVENFNVPICPKCHQDKLKPDIVFFGDNIPKNIVEHVNSQLSQCDAILCLGTSLQVYSAYRIVLKAKELKLPIAILNIGQTRGDKLANVIVNTICSEVVQKMNF